MKAVKIIVAVIVVAVIGFFAWNYSAGPLKVRRDMHAFADSLERCEPFARSIKAPGGPALQHTIEPLDDGRCRLRMDTLGPHELRCDFAAGDLRDIAQGFADNADSLGIFGGMEIRISTSNPDKLTQALNSDACETISK